MNVAVGTGIAQIAGVEIISTVRRRRLGNVDGKRGLIMAPGAILGVETGAYAIQLLKRAGQVDLAVSTTYITVLGLLSLYIIGEACKARKTPISKDTPPNMDWSQKSKVSICHR